MAPSLMGSDTALAGNLAVLIPAQKSEPALLFLFSHWFLSEVANFLASKFSGLGFLE